MKFKCLGKSGSGEFTMMKKSVEIKPGGGDASWSAAAAAALRDDEDDKRSDSGSDGDGGGGAKSYVEHRVKPTDTLQGLCLSYKISATKLRMVNKFSGSNLLMAPKTLRIPLGGGSPPTPRWRKKGVKDDEASKKGGFPSDEEREVPETEDAADKPPSGPGFADPSYQFLCTSSSVEVSGTNGLGGSDEAREAMPDDGDRKAAPEEKKEKKNISFKDGGSKKRISFSVNDEKSSTPPPPDSDESVVEASKRALSELIDSLGDEILTKPERTFLGMLLESNGPNVAEACAAARRRLMDGDRLATPDSSPGSEGGASPAAAVADEPFAALDGSTRRRLGRLNHRKRASLVTFKDEVRVPPSLPVIPDDADDELQDLQKVDNILRSFSGAEDDHGPPEQDAFEKQLKETDVKELKRPGPGDGVSQDGKGRPNSTASALSTSSGEEEEDCPICLLPLEAYDYDHPLQCPEPHCKFNCCELGCQVNMCIHTHGS